MHQAPPVEYPLGNTGLLNRAIRVAWWTVAAIDLAWLFLADSQGWRVWLGLALTLLIFVGALRVSPAPGAGVLHWDGSGWAHKNGALEVDGDLTVHLDLQSALLVAWKTGSGRTRWYWLNSATDPSRWLALRRALYSPRRAVQGGGDAVGAGTGLHA